MTRKKDRIYRSYRLTKAAIEKISADTAKILATGIKYDYSDYLNDLILGNQNCLIENASEYIKSDSEINIKKTLKKFHEDYLFQFYKEINILKDKIYKTFSMCDEVAIINILNSYSVKLKEIQKELLSFKEFEYKDGLNNTIDLLIKYIDNKEYNNLKDECNFAKKDINKMLQLAIKYNFEIINKNSKVH